MLGSSVAAVLLSTFALAQPPSIPPGKWLPTQVGICQRHDDPTGGWSPREAMVTLQWTADDWKAIAGMHADEQRRTVDAIDRFFRGAVEVVLLAGNETLACQQGRRGEGLWPTVSLYYALPKRPVTTLELYVRTKSHRYEPFEVELSAAREQTITIGPLTCSFERLDPSAIPVDTGKELAALRPQYIRNDFYDRGCPKTEPATRLTFVGPKHIEFPHAGSLGFDQAALRLANDEVPVIKATYAQSYDPNARPYFFFWLPIAPDRLGEGWGLHLKGTHLIVTPEVIDEQIYELPMPSSGP